MTMTMERPETVRNESQHSCTSQCPNPCPYLVSEADVNLAPGLVTDAS